MKWLLVALKNFFYANNRWFTAIIDATVRWSFSEICTKVQKPNMQKSDGSIYFTEYTKVICRCFFMSCLVVKTSLSTSLISINKLICTKNQMCCNYFLSQVIVFVTFGRNPKTTYPWNKYNWNLWKKKKTSKVFDILSLLIRKDNQERNQISYRKSCIFSNSEMTWISSTFFNAIIREHFHVFYNVIHRLLLFLCFYQCIETLQAIGGV